MRVTACRLLSRGTSVATVQPGTRSAVSRDTAAGARAPVTRACVAAGVKWMQEVSVAKEDRGFASMDRAKQREIASKGGKAAHQKGTAHEWTSEEAREAGRKGGMASHQRRKQSQTDEQGSTRETSGQTERSDDSDQNEQIR